MLFSEKHYNYSRSPLVETVCQLRFPTIFVLNSETPSQFKEAVSNEFAQYNVRQEKSPPKVTNPGTPQAKLEAQPDVMNHQFVSEDMRWKINLTKDFIALSTTRYTSWEDFAAKLDWVLAAFIQIYQPTSVERIGLRYVNAISRKAYRLTDSLWDDLIQSPYLGILGEPDVDETKVAKSALDTIIVLKDGANMHVRCGPGRIGKQNPEICFMLDCDLSMGGQLTVESIATVLNNLHHHASGMFNGAVTEELRQAMGPSEKQ